MAISLKHEFVSAKGDGTDPTKVQPSNWNAEHAMTVATGKVLGRSSANVGPVEELPASTLGLAILAAADKATLASLGIATTGDAKLTFKSTTDSGWIMLDDGSIGNAASGATTLASETAKDLFVLLWDSVSDTWAPVSGGRGTSGGLNDFNAGKKMTLPKALGRAIVIAGTGAGLTSRVLGSTFGSKEQALSIDNLPDADLPVDVASGQGLHTHVVSGGTQIGNATGQSGGGSQGAVLSPGTISINNATLPAMTGVAHTGGSATPFELTQPSFALNVMVKL